MPIYSHRCGSCGRDEDQFARVADRDANPPLCCGAAMARQITAPMVCVPENPGYRCPISGEVVTTHKRRKYLMDKAEVVDAREYKDTWARNRVKRAEEKAEVERELANVPDAVKRAVAETAPTAP